MMDKHGDGKKKTSRRIKYTTMLFDFYIYLRFDILLN